MVYQISFLVFSVFKIENDDELDVQLFTQKRSSIAPAQLKQFLMQYKSCSNFHIQVVFPQGAITGLSHEVNIISCFTAVDCSVSNTNLIFFVCAKGFGTVFAEKRL